MNQLTAMLITALGVLIPAATALAVAWLNARTEIVKQAALGAVHEADAAAANVQPMTGPEKKVMAVESAMARLPQSLRNEAKVNAQVQAAVAEVRAARATVPPSGVGPVPGDDDDDVDTVRDKPQRPPLPG